MSLKDDLMNAYVTQDWDLIRKVYIDLYGETPTHEVQETPVKKKGRPKKEKILELAEPTIDENFKIIKKEKKDTRPIRAISVTGKNLFNPKTKTEKEPGFDKIDDNVVPVPRSRTKAKLISVDCTKCHKKIKIQSSLAKHKRETFKCDRCIEDLVKGRV